MIETTVTTITYFIIAYMIFVAVFYLFMLIVSTRYLRSMFQLDDKLPYEELLHSSDTKPISITVPAYNEEVGIYSSVRSLLSMNYPEFEIIVVMMVQKTTQQKP